MKHKPGKPKIMAIHTLVWMCLLLAFTLFLPQISLAQTATSASIVDDFIAKNPNSPLVKYYQVNSNDLQVANAIKMAAILNSPERANYSQQDIDRMQAQIAEVKNQARKAESWAKDGGNNYERAARSMSMQEQQNAKAKDAGKTSQTQRTDANGVPIFSLPAAK